MSLENPEDLEGKEFLAAKKQALSYLSRVLKRTQNQVEKRKNILLSCQKWALVHHEGQLLQSNLYRLKKGMSKATLSDWEMEGKERTIQLDPLTDPKDQVAAFFFRSKKLKNGIIHAEKQLALILKACTLQEALIVQLEQVASISDLDVFLKTHPIAVHPKKVPPTIKKVEPAKPYRSYISESGLHIWVGKGAKQNDLLTFTCANGSDVWLHAHDYPGSHIILRCRKGQEPDQEALLDAAFLALHFSQNKDKCHGKVTVSQVKYLTRIKGAPGKVQVSKHRVIHTSSEKEHLTRLKERINP